MDQHDLGVADFPEIGSKSMVSRVLSGERFLNKRHIKTLSEHFGIEAVTQKLLLDGTDVLVFF
jgi:HTH-type transcriptional regulator/antitoxin HigA